MRIAIVMLMFLVCFCALAAEEALFFVTDVEGDTLFAVYPNGVIIKNAQGDKLFTAESDSIRAYVYDNGGGRTSRGGFAIGGVASATRSVHDYFHVSGDSVRIYLEEQDQNRTSRGGFAIGGVASATRDNNYYFNLERGLNPEIINPSQPRMLWYPAKEAIRMGRVLVDSPDSVGTNSMATGYESKAVGDYSQALGYRARAGGDYSTAIGYLASANADYAFAFGDSARALGENSFALGFESTAGGFDSFALGFGATAEGTGCFAMGSAPRDSLGNPIPGYAAANADGDYAYAFGLGTHATGVGAMAFGMLSEASEYNALAMGRGASAIGSSSVAIGSGANATSYQSLALGGYTNATGSYTTALGYFSTASGNYSTAVGRQCEVSGEYSFASAVFSTISGDYAAAFGRDQDVEADYGTTGGSDNTLTGSYSTAFGRENQTVGYNSFAGGGYNNVTGDYAVGLGQDNTVVGSGSFAGGYNNETNGHYATVLGRDNSAGYGSVAIGYSNSANSQYSFASGRNCQTTGDYATAMGYYSVSAQDGMAAGYQCQAGVGAVAMGHDSTAPESYSVAMGYHCDALGQGSVAIGNYATSDLGGVAIGEDVSAYAGGVAMGRNASNGTTMGSFVFGDYESIQTITNDAQNQFRVRCRGGYKFHTSNDLDPEKSIFFTSNEGNLGVGIEQPEDKLEVAGDMRIQYTNEDVSGADGALLKISNTSTAYDVMSGITFQNGSLANTTKGAIFYKDRAGYGRGNMLFCNNGSASATNVDHADADLVIYYDGDVGVGTDPDGAVSEKLTVAGNVAPATSHTYNLGTSVYRWNNVYTVNATTQTSDRRLKSDIRNLNYGLDDLMRLRPVSFCWKSDPDSGEHLGLIAQEVREIIPEAVVQENPSDYMGLRYTELVPVLIAAVQQQQQELDEVDDLRQQLEQSNNRIEQLEGEMAELRAMVQQMASAESSRTNNRQSSRQ